MKDDGDDSNNNKINNTTCKRAFRLLKAFFCHYLIRLSPPTWGMLGKVKGLDEATWLAQSSTCLAAGHA